MAEQQPGQVEQSSVRAPIFSFRDQVRDFARPNLFQVEIYSPPILQDGVSPQSGGVAGSSAEASENSAGGSSLNATEASAFGTFLVKAANIPASTVGVVEVPYRGRMLKIAGDRTFEPWTVTIMNDSKFSLRNAFETWVEKIQAANENITQVTGLGDEQDATGYFADMFVHQLSRDASKGDKANILRSYKFTDVFPSNVSAIDLDFGSNDAVEEFTVELQVQYWQAIPNGITA